MAVNEQGGDVPKNYGANASWSIAAIADFPPVIDAWNALNAGGQNLPILDGEFFRYLLEEFGNGTELIAVCRDGDQPVAAAIINRERTGVWQTFQPSQSPLGAWIQDPGRSQTALMKSLAEALPGMNLILGVTQQDPSILARPESDARTSTFDYIRTASIEVSGSFADYWAARGKNLRQNVRRTNNRLNRDGVRQHLEVVTDADGVANAVDDFGIIESRGWKAQQGTAMHPENDQGRFYRDLFRHYASRGEAIAYRYFFDSALVATDLCVHRDGVLIILKTTYDEEFGKWSPASQMRHEYFESVFDDSLFRRIEFYGKLMDWHTKWSHDIRTMYHVNSYRSSLVAKGLALLSRIRQSDEN